MSLRSSNRNRGIAYQAIGLLALQVVGFPVLCQEISGSITDRSSFDRQAVVSTAPGYNESSIYAGFDGNEQVQLYNGNLLVNHPSSAAFPLDGGGSFSLSRVFNSQSLLDVQIRTGDSSTSKKIIISGKSWVGYGWKTHLGRIYKMARESTSSAICQSGEAWCNRGRDFMFEAPDGSTFKFNSDAYLESNPVSCMKHGQSLSIDPHPILRVIYYRAAGEPSSKCEQSGMRPTWCDARTDANALECTHYGTTCDVSADGTAHYEVTLEDGTELRLEKRKDEELTDRGWIRNFDTAGWYTTRIVHPDGGSVTVTYHQNSTYPDAISSVISDQHPGYKIETTLWSSADSGDPDYISAAVGMLKVVSAFGPDGQLLTYKHVYQARVDDLGEGSVTLPMLTKVVLPAVGSPSAAPTIQYGYRSGFTGQVPVRPGTGPLLDSITYPTGGVSRYTYGEWECGVRKRQHDAEEIAGRRLCTAAVERKEVFPAGPTGAKSVWTWQRRFTAFRCPASGAGVDVQNYFRVTAPDGRVTVAVAYDSPCGNYGASPELERPGQMKSTTTYAADGVTKLRSEEYVFFDEAAGCSTWVANTPALRAVNDLGRDTSVVETRTTYFHDEMQGACFEPGTPATRSMTTRFADRDNWNGIRTTWTTGDYMARRGGANVSRVSHVAFYGPLDTPAKRLQRHVLGTYRSAFVEETTGTPCSGTSGDCSAARYEVNATFDGDAAADAGNGRLKQLRAKNEWLAVSSNLNAAPPTFQSTNAAADSDDLVSTLDYFSDGNLKSVTYSGGDPDIDGSQKSYKVDYTWQQAMATTMQMQGLSFYSRQIVPDKGRVKQDCDANGLCSTFSYDALGRLTTIDPPGTIEQVTRILYPDLKTTRLIQQASMTSTGFEATNSEQLYSQVIYDGLGRVKERHRALPDNKIGVQVVKFDDLGRTVFVSEWMTGEDPDGDGSVQLLASCGDGTRGETNWVGTRDRDGDGSIDYSITSVPTCQRVPCPGCGVVTLPWGTTTFYGTPSTTEPLNPLAATPDGLGRVVQTTLADGTVTKKRYCGPHEEVTVEKVHTATGDVSTTTRYYHDGLGRLVVVDAPAEGTDAEYRYDARGNLITATMVGQISGDPFQKWRDGTIVPATTNQTRSFVFDAVGRLRSATTPEKGLDQKLRYDSLGNLLLEQDALGAERCFFVRHRYDAAGRPIATERRLGTKSGSNCSATLSVDREQTAGAGSFESTNNWVKGKITNDAFTVDNSSAWVARNYPHCGISSPPGGAGATGISVIGDDCSYSAAGDTEHAIRLQAANVSRDDQLTFQYWRHVRENQPLGSGNLDKFSVFVTLNDPTSLTQKRVMFQLTSGQASHARWMQAPAIRPADFFSLQDWPVDQTRTLYIFLVFDKNDTATAGLGKGILVDNLTVGRKAIEPIAEQTWDVSPCGTNGLGGEACQGGEEVNDLTLGQVTGAIAYQDGLYVAQRYSVYKGLNGRPSGVRELLDWTGGQPNAQAGFEAFVQRMKYSPRGVAYELTAPYQPGKDTARTYRGSLKRDALSGVSDIEAAFYFFGKADGTAGINYDAAMLPTTLSFANGTSQTVVRDALHRIKSITSYAGATPTAFWATGTYLYDGAGNVKNIGVPSDNVAGSPLIAPQEFWYDSVNRLVRAQMAPQVMNPAGTSTTTDYSFDPYGNMLSHQRTAGASVPAGYDWSSRTYAGNRVTSHGFLYDAGGNTLRLPDSNGALNSALWDDFGRMRVLVGGDLQTPAGIPSESYLFDAAGNRFARQDRRGYPIITLRDAGGRALAEYVKKSADNFPKLERDFIYGAGRLLVERVVTGTAPHATGSDPMRTSNNYAFSVDQGGSASSYDVDIQTASGYQQYITGIQLGSNGSFALAESNLAANQTNFVRIRSASPEITGYSQPISVIYDPAITSSSTNPVRALAISRSGTNVLLRWELAGTTTKKFRVYFKLSDGSATYLLTPLGLSSTTRSFTLSDQSLAQVCGDFFVKLVLTETPLTESAASPSARLGSALSAITGPLDACGGGSGSNPIAYTFANSYHHRDHLGSLRAETDEAGNRSVKRDYHAFGEEMSGYAESADGATRRQFTEAERGVYNGLDYMMARFCSGNAGRFLSPDEVVGNVASPQSWNRFSYVLNSPLKYTDPSGKRAQPFHATDSGYGYTFDVTNTGTNLFGNDHTGGLPLNWFQTKQQAEDWDDIANGIAASEGENGSETSSDGATVEVSEELSGVVPEDVSDGSYLGNVKAGLWDPGIDTPLPYTYCGEKIILGFSAEVAAGAVGGKAIGVAFRWSVRAVKAARAARVAARRIAPQVAKIEKQLAQHGRGSVEKSLRSLEKRLVEHRQALETYRAQGGHTSSVEREIRAFEAEIQAIKDVLGREP